ncbi:hypothetical protein TWF718_007259 [Orbilia javanica]|uniref:Uncharacterized protein n=1 Tax=Orbilia javanica TaxID=47235 RepID=A0AAN8RD52_9PEZI
MTNEYDIKVAPGPWECTGESWWFPCYPLGGNNNNVPGAAHPLDFYPGVNDKFDGGLGMIMVVRYTGGPVGPYDEIVYMPGYYGTPYASSSRYRITNIYVSTKEALYNGRLHWNTPKHLAVFNFEKSETTGHTTITVAHPETPENPFFFAVVKNIPIISSIGIPMNTGLFPLNLELHQPNLRAVDTPEGKANGETGTDKWHVFYPWMGGKARFMKCVDIKNGNGDGTWPDKIDGVWGAVLKWDPGMKLRFPLSVGKSNL